MNKLKSVQIINYKCFERVSFRTKDINVLIGENNAGKSTAIESIKLIAFAIDRFKTTKFIECPEELSIKKIDRCIALKIDSLLIDINDASYKRNGKTSKIIGYFDNNLKIEIYIIDLNVYAVAYNKKITINNRNLFIKAECPQIYVMPHFNLLRESEQLIDDRRTKGDRFNYRSSLHFRNEIYLYQDKLDLLNNLLRQTWKNLRAKLEYTLTPDADIKLNIIDYDFAIEIKNYGSGLQMWLQILWFLCKINTEDCIVILDEPDVYIHADLQRKLYHLVENKFSQVVIATHSIEIISETNISNILIVDKTKNKFNFCKAKESLMPVLTALGTTKNIMLTNLQRNNKCLFVEGNDLELLDGIYKIANGSKTKSLKEIATCKLNGKDNYRETFGASKIFKEDSEGTFKTFCLLDKHYNENFNRKITEEAKAYGVLIHFLERIEIENYLIVPRIFASMINESEDMVKRKIVELSLSLKGETFDRILQSKILEYRKMMDHKDISQISKETREYVNANWNNFDNIVKIASGKELKGKIYDWLKNEFNIHCSDKKIIEMMIIDDIPYDLVEKKKKIAE